MQEQIELSGPAPLLDPQGRLTQAGWARHAVLDCNLENAAFYPPLLHPLQRLRVKRWDYYGITTPTHFFSATLADLGYAGQAFVYLLDFEAGSYREETLTIPLGRGVLLPRNSEVGQSRYEGTAARMIFDANAEVRKLSIDWASFGGQPLRADVTLRPLPGHESVAIVIPIGGQELADGERGQRFYYNRKVNCLPAEGTVRVGDTLLELRPDSCLGNLDWGRGVWEYRSFWVWASASGCLPGGRTVGLNLGFGFGDTSAATENALILDGRVHKLAAVDFTYDPHDFVRPWRMVSNDGRLNLEFIPFLERTAKTSLLVINSEVHQMFGRYWGAAVADDGETIRIQGLVGWAEEHRARW